MYTIVAGSWDGSQVALRVLADDGREAWGEDIPAASFDAIPTAADIRLVPTAYERTGPWERHDTGTWGPYDDVHAPAWTAAAEVPDPGHAESAPPGP